ncbi:MAG TPA: hypothetical protein VFG21_09225 [Xanthomonadaceae bacterium]|nr:hypothetical protein [Xanthomonadaceae bacterium]
MTLDAATAPAPLSPISLAERGWLPDWLANHDRNSRSIVPIMEQVYGAGAAVWNRRWRMFWMACAELFGYGGGDQWLVGHYRFAPR